MIERGELDPADSFVRDAAALNAVIGSAYATTHEAVVRAVARAGQERAARRDHRGSPRATTRGGPGARQLPLYALAVEAAARVDAGELHAAVLLATTALGAVETLQGCEYGLEIRVLAADALKRAGSPQAALARQRAVDYGATLMSTIR